MVLRRLKRAAGARLRSALAEAALVLTPPLEALQERLNRFVEAVRPTRSVPRSRPIAILCLVDLVQDLEALLPVMLAARDSGRFSVSVCMTTWLHRVSPWVPERLAAAGFPAIEAERGELLDSRGVDIAGFDALLTASESTAAPQRHGYALTRRANRMGLGTFTVQHGLENLALTSQMDGEHEFASKTILIWGPPAALPDWVPASRRRRCVGVGRPREKADFPRPLPAWTLDRQIVAVFENLHWERYSAEYAKRFLVDLANAARAFPQALFLVKPHPAGLWLARNLDKVEHRPENLSVVDSAASEWRQVTARDLIAQAACVITTPSTVALDAAEIDKPVAVAAYGMELEAYRPLPTLERDRDWAQFIAESFANGAKGTADLADFRRRHLIDGDASQAALQAIERAIRRRW